MCIRDRVKGVLDVLLTLPMVLPPTVVGYFLLLLFGAKRPLGIFFMQQFGVKPVSYTHLDVYKRQAKGCHRRSRLQTAAAGFVGIFCGGVLIFRSRLPSLCPRDRWPRWSQRWTAWCLSLIHI